MIALPGDVPAGAYVGALPAAGQVIIDQDQWEYPPAANIGRGARVP
jgi:hypothetical protein